MSIKEFEKLLRVLLNAREAIAAVKKVRRKYPAGVEMLLTPQQYKIMEAAERRLNEELESP